MPKNSDEAQSNQDKELRVAAEELAIDMTNRNLADRIKIATEHIRQAEIRARIDITEANIEVLRSLTPASPEDLNIDQWFVVADLLKKAGDGLEAEIKKYELEQQLYLDEEKKDE